MFPPPNPSESHTLAVLAQSEFLKNCPTAWQLQLVRAGRTERHADRAYLCHAGDPPQDVIVVLEGKLEVSRTAVSGKRHVLTFLAAGQVTGYLGAIDGKCNPHDVRAFGDMVALHIPREALRNAMAQEPAFMQVVVDFLCSRARILVEGVSDIALLSLQARTASWVHWLAGTHGVAGGDHQILDLKMSQAELADVLGVTRQSANRELKLLERKGLIRLGKQQIEVLDMDGLMREVSAER